MVARDGLAESMLESIGPAEGASNAEGCAGEVTERNAVSVAEMLERGSIPLGSGRYQHHVLTAPPNSTHHPSSRGCPGEAEVDALEEFRPVRVELDMR